MDNTIDEFVQEMEDDFNSAIDRAKSMKAPEVITKKGVEVIERFIQAEVDRLNRAKGIYLQDKTSCKLYGETPNYDYQEECINLWNWAVNLYNSMNTWRKSLDHLPTEEEFLTELAKYTYTAEYTEE